MSAYEAASLTETGNATAWLPADGPFRVVLEGLNEDDGVALERSYDGGATSKRLMVFKSDQNGSEVQGEPGAWFRLVLITNRDMRAIQAKVTQESV